MSPFRVARQQSQVDQLEDRRAWHDLGLPVEAREPHPLQCHGSARTRLGAPCANWASYIHEGVRYCYWHKPAGAERR